MGKKYDIQTEEIFIVGNNQRLEEWSRQVCAWGGRQQEIKLRGEAGGGLENLARETELYPVSITEPWG